jgi:hypothetical protein
MGHTSIVAPDLNSCFFNDWESIPYHENSPQVAKGGRYEVEISSRTQVVFDSNVHALTIEIPTTYLSMTLNRATANC